jgi:PncC family amidohydrolase
MSGNSITELSARVVETARATHDRIITVESCSAGALCTLLADTPGAGGVLLGGFVTYDAACKAELLGVPTEVIEQYSAVSQEVAQAMAAGALAKCALATIALAVTCVGGPKPDDDGNPVGLAYLAVQRRDGHAQCRELHIDEHSSGRIRGELLSNACRLILDELDPTT